MTKVPPKAAETRKLKTGRTVMALILREMGSTYGRSPGGYLWAVLEPVGAITVFIFVIAVGLKIRSPSIGTNFMLFYATGYLPFSLFNQTASKVAKSIRYSRQLLKYPGVRYTDAILARFLLNFLTHMMVFYIVMTGTYLVFDLTPFLDPPAIVLSFALAGLLGLGVGAANCFLMSMFPLWDSLWSILTRPLFLLSTVLYTFEQVPAAYQDVVWYNPLVHIVGLMRRGFYPTYDAPYVAPLYVLGISLVLLGFGLVFLNRYYREILNQ